MADYSFILYYYSHQRSLFKTFFFIPTTLALITSLFILCYISTTSHLFFSYHHRQRARFVYKKRPPFVGSVPARHVSKDTHLLLGSLRSGSGSQRSVGVGDQLGSRRSGNYMNNNEVFHERDIFFEDYKQMNRSFRIYVYPHRRDDPFANVRLPVDFEPSGNYASESYFKKILMKSHFITKDPNKTDLFFLPFSIARLRHDPRIGSDGIQDFNRHYISNISRKYPYWNQTSGADHFYVACHPLDNLQWRKHGK